MKGKLIKTDVNYILEDDKEVVIASTSLKKEGLSLSIKNCREIERGYDLDELAKREYLDGYDTTELCRTAFKDGFQKALELMGDKKFSEDDVILIAEYIRVASQSTPSVKTKDLFDEYQSLQQTEWDVEIETVPALSNNGNVYYGDIPKKDEYGCLILKRL